MKDKAKKNESKKKSFYFEDYDESKIFVNNKNANIAKVSLNRVTFLFLVFFSLVLIFSIKIIYLSLSPEKNFFSRNINLSFCSSCYPKYARAIIYKYTNVVFL